MAVGHLGEKIWESVGREPSGNPFNSLVQLEYEKGIPRNPFINAGALVVTDRLLDIYPDPKNAILGFVRELCGNDGLITTGRGYVRAPTYRPQQGTGIFHEELWQYTQ